MDEAVAWHATQALAAGEGTSEAAGEKLGVDSDCLVAGEHTRGDQRVAVEEGCRPIAALGVAQPHQATRRHRLGGGLPLPPVAIDPGLAGVEPLLAVRPHGPPPPVGAL